MHTHRLRQWLALAGLASLVLSPGCIDSVPLVTIHSTMVEEFKTGSQPKIEVETFNGHIDVSDSADDEVVVEVKKRASGIDAATASANLNDVHVTVIQKGDTIQVIAQRASGSHVNCGAEVAITAPKRSRLKLKSSNGHVICEGLQGGIQAKTSNASIEVVGSTGPIDVRTSNGGIEIEATGAVVDAHTSNARIRFSGSLADAKQSFKTSNGSIDLKLPPNSQFKYQISTSNARATNDFDPSTGNKRGQSMAGVIGSDPKCKIEAHTSNASVSVSKGDDL